MTLEQAKRITQLEIEPVPLDGTEHGFRARSGENIIAVMAADRPSAALSMLVERVYKMRATQAFQEQGYRCFICAVIKALTADHIVPRARGRLDVRSNLRGVCTPCHKKITDNKIDPQPHPDVLRFVEQHGWTWGPESNQKGWVRIDGNAS